MSFDVISQEILDNIFCHMTLESQLEARQVSRRFYETAKILFRARTSGLQHRTLHPKEPPWHLLVEQEEVRQSRLEADPTNADYEFTDRLRLSFLNSVPLCPRAEAALIAQFTLIDAIINQGPRTDLCHETIIYALYLQGRDDEAESYFADHPPTRLIEAAANNLNRDTHLDDVVEEYSVREQLMLAKSLYNVPVDFNLYAYLRENERIRGQIANLAARKDDVTMLRLLDQFRGFLQRVSFLPYPAALSDGVCVMKYLTGMDFGTDEQNDIDEKSTPVQFACQSGNVAAVKFLFSSDVAIRLEIGASVLPCLRFAINSGSYHILSLLGKDKMCNNRISSKMMQHGVALVTPLIRSRSVSLSAKCKTILKLVAKYHLSINSVDHRGNTMAHIVASGPRDWAKLARLLIHQDIDLSYRNSMGLTAAELAATHNRCPTIGRILASNSGLNWNSIRQPAIELANGSPTASLYIEYDHVGVLFRHQLTPERIEMLSADPAIKDIILSWVLNSERPDHEQFFMMETILPNFTASVARLRTIIMSELWPPGSVEPRSLDMPIRGYSNKERHMTAYYLAVYLFPKNVALRTQCINALLRENNVTIQQELDKISRH